MAKEASAREDKFIELQEKKAQEKKEEVAVQPPQEITPALSTEKVAAETRKEVKKDEKGKEAKGAEGKEAKKEDKTADEKAKEEKKEEKKREIILERVYAVPLREAYSAPQSKRGNKAIRLLRAFLVRHLKSENVHVAVALNNAIRARGTRHPMKKVKVKATKDKAGLVWAELAA